MIEIQDVPLSFLNFNIINYPLHNKSKGIESYFYEYINLLSVMVAKKV